MNAKRWLDVKKNVIVKTKEEAEKILRKENQKVKFKDNKYWATIDTITTLEVIINRSIRKNSNQVMFSDVNNNIIVMTLEEANELSDLMESKIVQVESMS
jgi:hypothetical protein